MYLLLCKTVCGRKPGEIVGGRAVTPYSLPWQVALVRPGSARPFCGGTLISDRHVLTAAHCMGKDFDVMVGEHDFTTTRDATRHTVCSYVNHPSYSQDTMNCDFAMVHLRTPVDIEKKGAAPACLPKEAFGGDFLVGKAMTVSGWGKLSVDGSQPSVLQSVEVPGITNAKCQEAYRGEMNVLQSMLCAGNLTEGGIDACQGDSGGNFFWGVLYKRNSLKPL